MANLVLDVSNNNPISLAAFKASGAQALICKATEGTNFHDGTLAAHRQIAHAAGKPFGSYLFLHPDSPGNEAGYYLNYAKPRKGDIQPIIDAEVADGESWSKVAARVDSCARELEKHGYKPILYASTSFWLSIFAARPGLKRLRVWEAQYPGHYTKWFPRLAQKRLKLSHGASVVLWQWTDHFQDSGHYYDASRLFVNVNTLLI